MELAGGMKDEFVVSLAAMALYDGEAEISSDQINVSPLSLGVPSLRRCS